MNIKEKVIDIVKGMEGIGGIPTDEERVGCSSVENAPLLFVSFSFLARGLN